MNFKKLLSSLIACSLLVTAVFAHGKKDIEELDASNVNSWSETFSLDGKKGKYNIMITATDLGGNVYVEGPHNIMIDPNSDKCIPGITNPVSNMRVVGNLNIVGTCVDDDGVDYVDLVLDGNEEAPVRAVGKEFWSYYLDTTDLEEGPHTIKVTGYDINGLQGKSTTLTWQLDRRQPVTAIKEKDMETDKPMGMLVSGTVKFQGLIEDGNGIKRLEYSLDNGETYREVKISPNDKKGNATFAISVNTKAFADGPAVLWFKATDKAGSVGAYSFLYFIDNTKPDVQIISPAKDEVVNGKFSVAGFAKDRLGITSLVWTFGTETGEVELIPGNPYWCVNFDTIGSKDKSRKFTITATDAAGNVVDTSLNISMDQEQDKPVVTLSQPQPDSHYSDDDELYVRGIITDDNDGVKGVRILLDGEEVGTPGPEGERPEPIPSKGVFYYNFGSSGALTSGKHKVTVIGVDSNGVEGNPTVVEIQTLGQKPQFEEPVVVDGKGEVTDFVNGLEVHPESKSKFKVKIVSTTGIKTLKTEYWSENEAKPEPSVVELKKPEMTYTAEIPVAVDSEKGVVHFSIEATDISDRPNVFTGMMYITNTTTVKLDEPKVVFDDSTIKIENGKGIVDLTKNDSLFPATGYFIGDKASKVELVPETPFATAVLKGNQIQLKPGRENGVSEEVVVRVTSSKGKTYDSIPLTFAKDNAVPKITVKPLRNNDLYYEIPQDQVVVDEETGEERIIPAPPVTIPEVTITGSASCVTGLNSVKYTVMSVPVGMAKGIIAKIDPVVVAEPKYAEVAEDGSFSFNISAKDYADGIHLIEITAISKAGNEKSTSVLLKKIAPLVEDSKGKLPVPKAPVVAWFDLNDVYAAGVYQSDLEVPYETFARDNMAEGSNALSWTATPVGGKGIAGKYNAVKAYTLSAHISSVAHAKAPEGEAYMSGLPVVLDNGVDKTAKTGTVTVVIDTGAPVSTVTYEISGLEGDETPGGDHVQTGAAKLIKPVVAKGEAEPTVPRWVAEIPLKNLPSRVTKVRAFIKAGDMTEEVEGTVIVMRASEKTEGEETVKVVQDDKEKVYTKPSVDMFYDSRAKQYGMSDESFFTYFANVPGPVTFALEGDTNGLEGTADNERRIFTLKSKKDGIYKDVKVVVTDVLGDKYESEAYTFVVDSGAPEVKVLTPVLNDWVMKSVTISGTAADVLGVNTIEYSLNNGETWTQAELHSEDPDKRGVTFSETVDISKMEDGLIQIDVRATDNGGNTVTERTSIYKDTTPPEVEVVLPLGDDIVNGETLVVFKVTDNGLMNRVEYVMPAAVADNETNNGRSLVEMNPLIHTLVGTVQCPIDDGMSFEFYDDAGNYSSVAAWKFLIDNESDLPIAEIHLPDEIHTITRDFTISGVVYDDDGPSSIFYKIDDGDFISYPEIGTSFSIPVSITTMKDNEHTVTVYAVDINGVKGPESTCTFKVSLNEPKAVMVAPEMDQSCHGLIELNGWATDKNGIKSVKVSLDNGNTYNETVLSNVEGSDADWSYIVDTRAIPGGSQPVFLLTTDNYDVQGLYSTMMNVDNDAPVITLESPVDESETTGHLFFSGFCFDNMKITEMYVTIRNLEEGGEAFQKELKIEQIISEIIDLTSLSDGFYNVQVTAKDAAGNASNLSRNIHLNKDKPLAIVDILYPLNGESKTGEFNVYGQAESETEITSLELYIDGTLAGETTLSDSGFYKFSLNPETISEGQHVYYVESVLDTGTRIKSREQTLYYSSFGPWVTIDNFVYGDFAANRPFLRGRAGYSISEDEILLAKEKNAPIELKEALAGKAVDYVELSLDNGKTFIPLSEKGSWKYRIENQDLHEGYHFFLVRVTMKNGEKAIERFVVQIDNTKPTVRLISPEEGGLYNQELTASGLSSDDVRLETVTIAFRKGDKSSYEVPKFIQGLYIDAHFWGATLFDIGAGLTFFDDNVKLQFQWGQFTQAQRNAVSTFFKQEETTMRYGGNVFGAKLLANISTIPFAFFFGHDFDWLSANIAIGANFSYFMETNSGTPQILSAVLAQLEFPRVHFSDARMFSTVSFYTEGSLWFIPTDVSASTAIKKLVPQVSIGLRVNIF